MDFTGVGGFGTRGMPVGGYTRLGFGKRRASPIYFVVGVARQGGNGGLFFVDKPAKGTDISGLEGTSEHGERVAKSPRTSEH